MENITIPLLCAILGAVLSYLKFQSDKKKDIRDEAKVNATQLTKIDVNLDFVRKNTDEIRLEQKDISKQMVSLADRVTIVEQSTKSAHKRIDNIEEKIQ